MFLDYEGIICKNVKRVFVVLYNVLKNYNNHKLIRDNWTDVRLQEKDYCRPHGEIEKFVFYGSDCIKGDYM